MEIALFLELATELEMRISKVYEKMSGIADNDPLAGRLLSMLDEEINHANILRRGKDYLKEMPDVFRRVHIQEDELKKGLDESEAFLAELDAGLSFRDGLTRLLKFEKRFERIHLNTALEVGEPSLTDLFNALMAGDQNHIRAVSEIIAGLDRGRTTASPIKSIA